MARPNNLAVREIPAHIVTQWGPAGVAAMRAFMAELQTTPKPNQRTRRQRRRGV
jgi:hypothetical protein